MTDIFEEVDQSLREDRIGQIWKKYQWFVYGGIVLIVGAVGVWEFLRAQRAAEIDKAAQIYDSAFVAREKNDLTTARADFEKAGVEGDGFRVLSGHMLAGVEQNLTNDMAAVEKHLAAAAAADKGVMGDLALLKLGYAKADSAPIAELETTLKPLLDKKGYASALARELIAAKALAEGDVERARAEFADLELEIDAPTAMKQRVAQAIRTLPPPAIKPGGPAAPAAPAPAAPAPATTTPAPTQPGQ